MVVVLFSTEGRDDVDAEDYSRTSARMHELVAGVPGFISYNSYSDVDGNGVAIARFESHEAVAVWRKNLEDMEAQRKGRESYYSSYWVQVCDTVREYRFTPHERYTRDLRDMFSAQSTVRPGI